MNKSKRPHSSLAHLAVGDLVESSAEVDALSHLVALAKFKGGDPAALWRDTHT